ncbi:hypothetical protein ACTFIW_008627 [Dictyostelium discoideum]
MNMYTLPKFTKALEEERKKKELQEKKQKEIISRNDKIVQNQKDRKDMIGLTNEKQTYSNSINNAKTDNDKKKFQNLLDKTNSRISEIEKRQSGDISEYKRLFEENKKLEKDAQKSRDDLKKGMRYALLSNHYIPIPEKFPSEIQLEENKKKIEDLKEVLGFTQTVANGGLPPNRMKI